MNKIIQKIANFVIELTARLRAKFFSVFFDIGEDTLILKGFEVRNPSGIKIGTGCYINVNCFIQGSGGVTIGNDVLVGPHVSIFSENHNFSDINKKIKEQGYIRKPVVIGNNIWIGANVTIVPGVRIGDNSVIGAGAVVTKDIPNSSIVGGVPAKVIKKRI